MLPEILVDSEARKGLREKVAYDDPAILKALAEYITRLELRAQRARPSLQVALDAEELRKVQAYLKGNDLPALLADRAACKTLKNAILSWNPDVIFHLGCWALNTGYVRRPEHSNEQAAKRGAMKIEVLAVNELLRKQFPPTDTLIGNGLIDKSGAVLISGPQKIGKSLFATHLALCLGSGRSFLGFPVGQALYRTLILQAEVGPRRMQERFAKQTEGFPPEALSRVLSASVFSSVKLDHTMA